MKLLVALSLTLVLLATVLAKPEPKINRVRRGIRLHNFSLLTNTEKVNRNSGVGSKVLKIRLLSERLEFNSKNKGGLHSLVSSSLLVSSLLVSSLLMGAAAARGGAADSRGRATASRCRAAASCGGAAAAALRWAAAAHGGAPVALSGAAVAIQMRDILVRPA